MTTRSFKSSGITGADLTTQRQAVAPAPKPVGIKTPLRQGTNGSGILDMHFSVADQMKNNLRDLILTNWGERLGLFDYGANLLPLAAEYERGKDWFDDEAVVRIRAATAKYMPFVELETYESVFVEGGSTDGLGIVRITVYYSIPRALVPTTALQVTFAVS